MQPKNPEYGLTKGVREKIGISKILLIGAGGIGCEILKNLAISGFRHIVVIDLDTIDVSNLNRQFLFRKEHVGKSKAITAKEAILDFNPKIDITAHHDTIFNTDFNVPFYKQFDVVLNALDNISARSHVNRMCLNADVPLIESGTSGYSGQIQVIQKGVSACYECFPAVPQKTYPGCTIRNTPSEPVHCIVWAKHLFNQLFGEDDPDQDVSPDTEDPELQYEKVDQEADELKKTKDKVFSATNTGNIQRVSTRKWAEEHNYTAEKLFNKFFYDDIKYLLSMENLWKTRKSPIPITFQEAKNNDKNDTNETAIATVSSDVTVWPVNKCCTVFEQTVNKLKLAAKEKILYWDKDEQDAMDFVSVCANIRSHIFGIEKKSPFDIKSIAGNIVPAIATANAIIAGLVPIYTIRILADEAEVCPQIYMRLKSVHTNAILQTDAKMCAPNPTCYVCRPQNTISVQADIERMTVAEFESNVLKAGLHLLEPDVMIDGSGIIVLSSEEGETEENLPKTLHQVGITDGSILKIDDFRRKCELTVLVYHRRQTDEITASFTIDLNGAELQTEEDDQSEMASEVNNCFKSPPKVQDDDDDDVEFVDIVVQNDKDEDPQEGPSSKRRKLEDDSDDDLIMID